MKQYLIEKFGAVVCDGQEADDALGIHQTGINFFFGDIENSVICSIDKDLLQIPGQHYNWVKGEFNTVTELEGRHRFWTQVLVGDATDNITSKQGLSCPGIGQAKAYLALEGEITEEEYFRTVIKLYKTYCLDQLDNNESLVDHVRNRIALTAQLVKIRTKEGEIWTPPVPFCDVGL